MSAVTGHGGRTPPSGGFELWAWYFMRVSGLALVFLALGHLVIMHLINSVDSIDYAFVAARYATPLWRTYDGVMLTLALLHGANGARVVIDDYFSGMKRVTFQAVLGLVTLVLLILGCYVLFTFQPDLVASTVLPNEPDLSAPF